MVERDRPLYLAARVVFDGLAWIACAHSLSALGPLLSPVNPTNCPGTTSVVGVQVWVAHRIDIMQPLIFNPSAAARHSVIS
jgi:hypothetical protein